VVEQARIVATLAEHPVDVAVNKLIDLALEGGAPDNVTVVAVTFRDAGTEETVRPASAA